MTTKLFPCPFCGAEPEDDLTDVLYKTGKWKDHPQQGIRGYFSSTATDYDGFTYTMHCSTDYGGCGATMSGDSFEETVSKWNRRPT